MTRDASLSTSRQGLLMRLGAGTLLVAAAAMATGQAQAQSTMPGAGAQQAAMHRMWPGMHGGMSMFPERALDTVGATPEQKARLREIFKVAADDLRAQRDSGRALRQQMVALMAAPQVDPVAAEALRQQQLVVHDVVSRRMLQATLEAQAVLTPEQRAMLAQQMSERQRQMQHRMERHGGPGAPRG